MDHKTYQRRLRHTAVHEAGHAVMCWAFDVTVEQTTIEPSAAEGWLGQCKHLSPLRKLDSDPSPDGYDLGLEDPLGYQRYVMIALAGAEAVRVAGLPTPLRGARDDTAIAWEVCERVTRSWREARALMRWLRLRTYGALDAPNNRAALDALTEALLAHRTLDGTATLAALTAPFK